MKGNKTQAVKSPFAGRFLYQLKKSRKLFIIFILLQLMGIPLHIYSLYLRQQSYSSYQQHEFFSEVTDYSAGIMIAVAMLFGSVIALKTFSYLQNRSGTDLEMSLPLSRTQMFLADFFSGLFICIVPYIIIILLTAAALSALKSDQIYKFIIPPVVTYEGNLNTTTHSMFEYEIPATMLFVYTFSVLISVCCGKLTDTVAYLILTNVSIYLLCTSTGSFIGSFIPEEEFVDHLYTFKRISPAGALLHAFTSYNKSSEYFYLIDKYEWINWMIWCTAAAVLCFTAALFIFRRRKAESTGKSIAVTALFHAVVICFTAGIFFSVSPGYNLRKQDFTAPDIISIILAFLFSLAVFTVLFFFKERRITLNNAVKNMICPVSAALLSLIVYITCINAEGFGIAYRVPDVSDIIEAKLQLPVWPEKYGQLGDNTYSDADDLKKITDLNRELNNDLRISLTDPDALNNYASGYPDIELFRTDFDDKKNSVSTADDTITITYCLKNGKEYSRKFVPCVTDYSKSELFLSDTDRTMRSLNDCSQSFKDIMKNHNYQLFCGSTDFTEKLYGKRFHRYITCNDNYPKEYLVKNYDEKLLDEIISKAYYPYYFDVSDCFVFGLETPNPALGKCTLQLFLPAGYSDLYEKFMESAETEKVKWYKYAEDGSGPEIIR